ncbi:MAG: hypothetical protein LQ339_008412 [Xanthoria mediterranea]|nr:MAG: hypothetical protein LQ339_008412 [Xanthoria mediterranea]
MFKGRSKGGGRGPLGASVVKKIPLNGLFTDALWRCNCAPRLPATRFQTKNGGKNHGRWFYTCQQPQPKRCNFFLWDDEAKSREAAAVLSNSRTEPISAPQTPTKSSLVPGQNGLQTPYTATSKRYGSLVRSSPHTPSKSSPVIRSNGGTQDTSTIFGTSDEESYDWPASDDEDVLKVVENVTSMKNMPPPETPRKAAKTDTLTSPGKRRFVEMQNSTEVAYPALEVVEDDIHMTPSTTSKKDGLSTFEQALSLPAATPTPLRSHDVFKTGQDSELTLEVFKALHNHQIHPKSDAEAELKGICDKYSLATRGIIKGRDISRAMVNAKNGTISVLQETIASLQAERETNRAVIRHLRRDMEVMNDGMKMTK